MSSPTSPNLTRIEDAEAGISGAAARSNPAEYKHLKLHRSMRASPLEVKPNSQVNGRARVCFL